MSNWTIGKIALCPEIKEGVRAEVDHFTSEFSKNDLPAFYERAPEWDIV
jgi:hypothetical protein